MIQYVLKRPVAVLTICCSLVFIGLYLTGKVPVALLPGADIPVIVVRVNASNTPAKQLDENIVSRIRESMGNLHGLREIDSRTTNQSALIYLYFEFDVKMSLAYIEVNEKLDRLITAFPKEMERPNVIRVNTTDIPIIRLQVLPKNEADYLKVSTLCETVLKKRLEQIPGVSLVDLNGLRKETVIVQPDDKALQSLGLKKADVMSVIQNANQTLGGLRVAEGQYRYFVTLSNNLTNVSDIEKLPVHAANGTIIPLNKIAQVRSEIEPATGYHLFNGRRGLVITVHEQAGSRMNELMPLIKGLLEQFKKDYQQVQFDTSQDQSFLLDAGIDNLYQDLIYGSICTILLLFMFLGDWASPALMSISIPFSLVFTFLFFYLFKISFNIISLSGIALGIGMLIDNSIIVVDNISRHRKLGHSLNESCISGTSEMITPVISQVLTTVAVYIPLLLFGGIAGILIFDQSVALSISLGTSLLVAFFLVPLLYKLFLRKSPKVTRQDTFFYRWVARGYHKMITSILKRKMLFFSLTLLMMPVGFLIVTKIPVATLPKTTTKDGLINIDWNMPIDADENLRLIEELLEIVNKRSIKTECEVGARNFLLEYTNNTMEKSSIYYLCKSEKDKKLLDLSVKKWKDLYYPRAILSIQDAPNAFTQLFKNDIPYLEARLKPEDEKFGDENEASFEALVRRMAVAFPITYNAARQPNVTLMLDQNKMSLYQVDRREIDDVLKQQFGSYLVTSLNQSGAGNVILKTGNTSMSEKLGATVKNTGGVEYPLSQFVNISNNTEQKVITADRTGEYRAIQFTNSTVGNVNQLQAEIENLASRYHFNCTLKGTYFDDQAKMSTMNLVFLLVTALLYLILTIQYEHLILPLIVMLTIPLGVSGAMLLLWLSGSTLNVMTGVGFIVILGLIVDDPILKIEVLIRLEKKYSKFGLYDDPTVFEKMIHEAGDICLKPLLMVSLTTSIAMIPVLLVGGLGNDLQKPMAIVIIGGLTIGTFFTTWFTPLAYWYVSILLRKFKFI